MRYCHEKVRKIHSVSLKYIKYFKNMDTTNRAAEGVQHGKGATKKIQTTWRKIFPTNTYVKIYRENSPAFSRTCKGEKKREIIEAKYRI